MSSPDLTDADRQAVIDVINTPNLSMGGRIQEFEKAFCDHTGRKHAIGVNSGTAGLHLCVRAAGIGPGELVIDNLQKIDKKNHYTIFIRSFVERAAVRECNACLRGYRPAYGEYRSGTCGGCGQEH